MLKVGFIGTGNMGSAIATAISKSDTLSEIFLSDKEKDKAKELSESIDGIVSDNEFVAKNCDIIFFAVKPQVLKYVVSEVKEILKARTDRFFIVTMAAGVSIESFEDILGAQLPIIRIMPNTPVSIGEGVVLYTPNSCLGEQEEKDFLSVMAKSGIVEKIDENLIDAASAISGCGPAFAYMFISSLADGGVKCGLSYDTALKLAQNTVSGAAKLIKESGKHPEKLKNEVCSPKGTTISGVEALEKNKFRYATMEAVVSAYERTIEINKK